MSQEAIYERRGDLFFPTKWAGSPWSAGLQHGGPLNALFARSAELAAQQVGLQVARLTVDLFKPVPTEPLACRTRFARRGRRIANLEIEFSLEGEETPLSKATAVLLMRRDDLTRTPAPERPPAPSLEDLQASPFMPKSLGASFPPGFHFSLEIGFGRDPLGAFASIHTPLDLVAGEPITPLQHSAAVADLTFGLSMRLQAGGAGFATDSSRVPMINTDTSIQWERPPVGDRIFFRESRISDEAGIGLASVSLYDELGRLGLSTQVLLAQQGFGGSNASSETGSR
ncbi:MAG: acyl-CoA thioesterase domain-containing protein [Myxococcota bacterium]